MLNHLIVFSKPISNFLLLSNFGCQFVILYPLAVGSQDCNRRGLQSGPTNNDAAFPQDQPSLPERVHFEKNLDPVYRLPDLLHDHPTQGKKLDLLGLPDIHVVPHLF